MEPSYENPREIIPGLLWLLRHELGEGFLPEYRATVDDLGDRAVFSLPDGRRVSIPAQAADPGALVPDGYGGYQNGMGSPGLATITYRLCVRESVQILGYTLKDDSPPMFTGSPILPFKEEITP